MRFRILPLAESDWPAVRALMAQTPMSAALPLLLTRAEALADAYPSLGAENQAFVAFEDGVLQGFIHGRVQRVWAPRGERCEPRVMAYIGDLRIARRAQGRGLTQVLLRRIVEEGRARGIHEGYGLVNEGNVRMLRALHRVEGLRFRPVFAFTTVARLLATRPPSCDAFEPVAPTDEALEQLHASCSRRPFAPVLDQEQFIGAIRGIKDAVWFTRRGREGLCFMLWDPAPTRTLSLARSPLHLAALRAGWNLLRPLSGAQRFPDDAVPWISREVAFIREGEDLDEIAKAAAFLTYQAGGHLISLIEPPFARVRGFSFRLSTQLVSMSLNGAPAVPAADSQPFIELPFV